MAREVAPTSQWSVKGITSVPTFIVADGGSTYPAWIGTQVGYDALTLKEDRLYFVTVGDKRTGRIELWIGTQAAYTALTKKDKTIYLIARNTTSLDRPKIWIGSRSEYNALTPDAETVYFTP